jgi:hypothetical protein
MKTAELTGAALDWAVSKCEGITWEQGDIDAGEYGLGFAPSTDWAAGGLIIEQEMIEIGAHEPKDIEWVARDYWKENTMTGPTPLIAAMRCYVAAKLGADVDLPEGLA